MSSALARALVVAWLALVPGPIATVFVDTAAPPPVTATLALPLIEGSVRFAVMGDTGHGTQEQYQVARQMAAVHRLFPFDLVIMLGDNIYGADAPADMRAKFEVPYKPLIDAGVEFRAVLGNHDNPNQRLYRLFGMGGERYYSFQPPKGPASGPGSVRFFALDSGYLDKLQLDWLDAELAACDSEWRLAYFHHPLYSSGRTHGSSLESRAVLEPLFVKHGVSAAFSGHDHVYERIKPQKGGIVYWVSGAGGSLRPGDVRAGAMTAKAFDRDFHFMIVEISGDDLYFQVISRGGLTVDGGRLHRRGAPAPAAAAEAGPAPGAAPSAAPPPR